MRRFRVQPVPSACLVSVRRERADDAPGIECRDTSGLSVAFKSGAVTGMLVAGLALLAVVVYYSVLTVHLGYEPGST